MKRLLSFMLCITLTTFMYASPDIVMGMDDTVDIEMADVADDSITGETTFEVPEEEETPPESQTEELFSVSDTRAVQSTISLNSYNGGGTIVLSEDTMFSGQCQLTGNLTIDLNGHIVTMGNNANFMLCSDNAVLNIQDSTGGGVIYASCQLVWEYNGGTFNLYSGILDGSQMTSYPQMGGCVLLSRNNMGTNVFNMYGGTIRGFEATQYGGAVYVASTFSGKTPTFNMYGGTIENCYALEGAAVAIASDGDGPGYFYIKGGTKQGEGGEGKATINCVTYNGQPVQSAISNYGYLGMEGVVDIDGIVYLYQNNWADTVTHFIKITGRLVVVGDGYIDIDSSYPNDQICTGHTVVENVTQTAGGTENPISQEEFYTYSSYFINSTKGLLISAGYDPGKNELSSTGSPANWPTYQADKYSQTYTYVDVKGQTLLIQASDSPGDKRTMQNYNYLIYTKRADASEKYAEYYSIKISKRDIVTGSALDGATFSEKRKLVDDAGNVTYESLGVSGTTGNSANGVESGETYIYMNAALDGKLMVDDGTYILVEETAPDGYFVRGELATIEIRHKLDESTGELVSVVEVMANNKVLSTSEQVINSTYGDKGWLVNREIVLYLNNSTDEIQEKTDYKIQIQKYQDELYQIALANATFELSTTGEVKQVAAAGTTGEDGKWNPLDINGSNFTFTNGDSYELRESASPEEYYIMDDVIDLSVNDDNQVFIDHVPITDGQMITMAQAGGMSEHGNWMAVLEGDLLTFKIYDEQMPPSWNLMARKYGTQQIEALALAGAEFTLYKVEMVDGQQVKTEVVSVVSSDGEDGTPIGTMLFVDDQGDALKLECDATYILHETYAPLGYELMQDITFLVNEDCSNIEVTQNNVDYSGASYDAANRILTLSIINEAVYHMPETGKSGIYPLVSIGILMMCISAGMLVQISYKRESIR